MAFKSSVSRQSVATPEIIAFCKQATQFAKYWLPEKYIVTDSASVLRYRADAQQGDQSSVPILREFLNKHPFAAQAPDIFHLLTVSYTVLVGYECQFGRCEDYAYFAEAFALLFSAQSFPALQHYAITPVSTLLKGAKQDHVYLMITPAPLPTGKQIPLHQLKKAILFDPFTDEGVIATAEPEVKRRAGVQDLYTTLCSHQKWGESSSALYSLLGISAPSIGGKPSPGEVGIEAVLPSIIVGNKELKERFPSLIHQMQSLYVGSVNRPAFHSKVRDACHFEGIKTLAAFSDQAEEKQARPSASKAAKFQPATSPERQKINAIISGLGTIMQETLSAADSRWRYDNKNVRFWLRVNAAHTESVQQQVEKLGITCHVSKVRESTDSCFVIRMDIGQLDSLVKAQATVGSAEPSVQSTGSQNPKARPMR